MIFEKVITKSDIVTPAGNDKVCAENDIKD